MNKITTRTGREFKAANYLGQSLAIVPKEYRPSIPFTTPEGEKKVSPAYKADVVVMSGADEGSYFEDVLLFQKALIAQIERQNGDVVIGTLTRVATFQGDNSYYYMEDPTTAEIRLASKYGV
jgi:hypothetical protein